MECVFLFYNIFFQYLISQLDVFGTLKKCVERIYVCKNIKIYVCWYVM